MRLIPDETVAAIFRCEDRACAAFMLVKACMKIRGHAAIKRSILAIGEQIDSDEIKACDCVPLKP
ncbi:MAG: hypothetical protein Hens3KO_18850 [Henriciella sp.]